MNTEGGKSGEGGTAGGSTAESSEEEQEESSSSSPSQKQIVEDILDNFREKWKQELQISKQLQKIPVKNENSIKEDDTENTAKVLFLNGVELERNGQLYEAIQYYRRAVQLVPDIEFRLDNKIKNKTKEYQGSEENVDGVDNTSENNEDDNDISDSDSFEDEDEIKEGGLLLHIQRKLNKNHRICTPKNEQKSTHISALPMEIILYMLRWVVSSDLDVRSLEMCSRTCRGFYVCCHDSEIWRLICARTWGLSLGNVPNGFNSWRQMYVNRARLRFNGCYISKTTYIRHGENSFQDQFYRPWHIVTYYRYLRFFPEGLVLMLTTADEPAQCVGLLKYRTTRSPAILSGQYILKDDKVTLVVHRHETSKSNPIYKRNRKREFQDNSQQRFHLEMQIQNYKNQKHIQLVWTGYSVHTRNRNGTESTCGFEIVGNRFPPLWFSRVKSYTAESCSPLQ
ncbi:hypothetical protein ILUMI_21044 [Ignelater luminosus]|uniref:F-box only protein 9 n=1 Tax=Ignelater luminosus TaxID=2038154 RepID=A0A8K0CCW5_IGNLU|nr:hypothetical protein ILUMI_21044 [Ignelater luminosus]